MRALSLLILLVFAAPLACKKGADPVGAVQSSASNASAGKLEAYPKLQVDGKQLTVQGLALQAVPVTQGYQKLRISVTPDDSTRYYKVWVCPNNAPDACVVSPESPDEFSGETLDFPNPPSSDFTVSVVPCAREQDTVDSSAPCGNRVDAKFAGMNNSDSETMASYMGLYNIDKDLRAQGLALASIGQQCYDALSKYPDAPENALTFFSNLSETGDYLGETFRSDAWQNIAATMASAQNPSSSPEALALSDSTNTLTATQKGLIGAGTAVGFIVGAITTYKGVQYLKRLRAVGPAPGQPTLIKVAAAPQAGAASQPTAAGGETKTISIDAMQGRLGKVLDSTREGAGDAIRDLVEKKVQELAPLPRTLLGVGRFKTDLDKGTLLSTLVESKALPPTYDDHNSRVIQRVVDIYGNLQAYKMMLELPEKEVTPKHTRAKSSASHLNLKIIDPQAFLDDISDGLAELLADGAGSTPATRAAAKDLHSEISGWVTELRKTAPVRTSTKSLTKEAESSASSEAPRVSATLKKAAGGAAVLFGTALMTTPAIVGSLFGTHTLSLTDPNAAAGTSITSSIITSCMDSINTAYSKVQTLEAQKFN